MHDYLSRSSVVIAGTAGATKISLFAIAAALILVGVTTWANSGHSASQAEIGPPPIDPFSIMMNAKNLPTQESLHLQMWPDNGAVRY
jgi:hypothetical protein